MSLPERIEAFVRQWPQWSIAERRNLDAIVWEVVYHMESGNGNKFIQWFCDRHLKPHLGLSS